MTQKKKRCNQIGFMKQRLLSTYGQQIDFIGHQKN